MQQHFDEADLIVLARYGSFNIYDGWKTYLSRDECLQNLENEVELAITQLGATAASGFCSATGGNIRLNIIYKRD